MVNGMLTVRRYSCRDQCYYIKHVYKMSIDTILQINTSTHKLHKKYLLINIHANELSTHFIRVEW